MMAVTRLAWPSSQQIKETQICVNRFRVVMETNIVLTVFFVSPWKTLLCRQVFGSPRKQITLYLYQ